MSNYMYEITVKDRGYVEVKTLSRCELQKYVFVVDHLA